MASLGVYGIVIGAWASNNKFSLLGGVRGSAVIPAFDAAFMHAHVRQAQLDRGLPQGVVVVLAAGFSVPYYIWDPTFTALTGAACSGRARASLAWRG